MFHAHSFTYHPCCIMFLSRDFRFPLSVSLHRCLIPIHSTTTHTSTSVPLSVPFHQRSTFMFFYMLLLLQRQTEECRETSKNNVVPKIGEPWIETCVSKCATACSWSHNERSQYLQIKCFFNGQCAFQSSPGTRTTSCTVGIGSVSGGKAVGAWRLPPTNI